ncbi:DUF1850 domain-containing protein [Oceanobacillus piezotolerans]|uniref:DUF1850 domain-containing protein n=1 Tax=Oceanobacillus piezotolerans TaxID=2448030 RepID=A0A498DEK7_9BACI|nr:DUF1850 domain-containing protein [Oceanobacillus piezotolerans]RLL41809.1 DUF1850 domain-containing protein [Oceanobacillus piezotolerans]
MTLQRKQIILVSAVAIAALILLVPIRTSLVFYKENTNQIEAYLPVSKGDRFQLIFTHSIHLTDVVEKYIITDDLQIKQNEIIYEEFGIGMPSNALAGEEFEYVDGKYHIKGLDNIFPSMNIRNGKTVSENRLVWGENQENLVWFNEYFNPGAWFTVKVENLTLWQTMKGARIHD